MKVIRTKEEFYRKVNESAIKYRQKGVFLENLLVEGVDCSDKSLTLTTSNCVFSNCNFMFVTICPEDGITTLRKCNIVGLDSFRVSEDKDDAIIRIYDSNVEKDLDFHHYRTDIFNTKIKTLSSYGLCNLYNCDVDTVRAESGMSVINGKMKNHGSHIRLLSMKSGLFNASDQIIKFVEFSKDAETTEIYNTIVNYCDIYNVDFKDFVFGTTVFLRVSVVNCDFSKCRNLEGSDFSIKFREVEDSEIVNNNFGDSYNKDVNDRYDGNGSSYYKFSQTVPSAHRKIK